MPISLRPANEIDQLIADLRPAAPSRATRSCTAHDHWHEPLTGSSPSSKRRPATSTRLAALRTLEGIADPRALDVVLNVLNDPDDAVACGAASAVQVFLRSARGADVVDRPYTSCARHAPALGGAPGRTYKRYPIWKLRHSCRSGRPCTGYQFDRPGEGAGAVSKKTKPDATFATTIEAAARGELPDPAMLKHAIIGLDRSVSLALIHRVLERIREREVNEPSHRADGVDDRTRGRPPRSGQSRQSPRPARPSESLEGATTAVAGGVPVCVSRSSATARAWKPSPPRMQRLAVQQLMGGRSILQQCFARLRSASGSRQDTPWSRGSLNDGVMPPKRFRRVTGDRAAFSSWRPASHAGAEQTAYCLADL